MTVDYDKARDFVNKLAEKMAKDELEKDTRYYDEDTTEKEKVEDQESAELVETTIQFAGELLIDIAESLNKIAGGDKLSRGRRSS